MKIIVVLLSDILNFPPVISLVNIFNSLKIQTILVTTKSSYDASNMEYVTVEHLNIDYEKINNPMDKISLLPKLRRKTWYLIEKHYNNNSVIWSVSNLSLKFLGNRIKKYRYVLHLLELSEDLRFYKKIPFLKLDAHSIAEKAKVVVVSEYNRAHITQAWWNLTKTPMIFSNKPYLSMKIKKNVDIMDGKASTILDQLNGKKIILYQGIISPERPLDKLIKAVGTLGNDYAFVVMSGGKNIYKDLGIKNYYFIPFVKPPMHLQITSRAFIGVLSYFPTKTSGYSVLNSIYCAPNKTYEFGLFGIPMLGNDIPGLKYLFNMEKCGVCFESFEQHDICEAIREIEDNNEIYSQGAKAFYAKTDSEAEIKNILKQIFD